MKFVPVRKDNRVELTSVIRDLNIETEDGYVFLRRRTYGNQAISIFRKMAYANEYKGSKLVPTTTSQGRVFAHPKNAERGDDLYALVTDKYVHLLPL